MIEAAFWQGKRVFVTGHTGFKGGWLSAWLTSLGAQVTGYALAPDSEPSLYQLCRLQERVTSVIADIRDPRRLSEAMAAAKPELVFHLAAQPLVRRSYREPAATFATNVMGTVNLLEAVRGQSSVRAVIIITSDKCYENQGWVWGYRETDPMGGYDPYSASKGCAELVSSAYRRSFFASPQAPALASVRAGNVVGGGDWSEDRLVPDAVRSLSRGQPLVVRNPRSVRPWQHVLEPLSGYLILAERLYQDGKQWEGGWNFGPNEKNAIDVAALASRIVACWGDAVWENAATRQSEHEAEYLRLDSNKARSLLGWQPLLDIKQTVEMTIAWYRAVLAPALNDGFKVTLTQLARYQELMESAAPAGR